MVPSAKTLLFLINARRIFVDEVWKDVVGYEDFYLVSNLGEMWSKRKNRELLPSTNNCGYKQTNVVNNGITKCLLVHRAVAMAFLDNPDNLPVVNHIDENPLNNNVENLEWCTISYNNSYNDCAKKKCKTKKKIYQYGCDGNLINVFESTQQAARELEISSNSIVKCCKEKVYSGRRTYTINNFTFFYMLQDKDLVLKRFTMSRSKKNNNILSKSVLQFDLHGCFIKEYPSTREVGRQFNTSSSNIAACCRGELKQSKGYVWKYKEE